MSLESRTTVSPWIGQPTSPPPQPNPTQAIPHAASLIKIELEKSICLYIGFIYSYCFYWTRLVLGFWYLSVSHDILRLNWCYSCWGRCQLNGNRSKHLVVKLETNASSSIWWPNKMLSYPSCSAQDIASNENEKKNWTLFNSGLPGGAWGWVEAAAGIRNPGKAPMPPLWSTRTEPPS